MRLTNTVPIKAITAHRAAICLPWFFSFSLATAKLTHDLHLSLTSVLMSAISSLMFFNSLSITWISLSDIFISPFILNLEVVSNVSFGHLDCVVPNTNRQLFYYWIK